MARGSGFCLNAAVCLQPQNLEKQKDEWLSMAAKPVFRQTLFAYKVRHNCIGVFPSAGEKLGDSPHFVRFQDGLKDHFLPCANFAIGFQFLFNFFYEGIDLLNLILFEYRHLLKVVKLSDIGSKPNQCKLLKNLAGI